MTQGTTSQDTFETTLELERTIAEAMWSVRPTETSWDSMVYIHNQIGGLGSSITKVLREGALIDRKSIIKEIAFTVDDLREVMYKPGKGSWLSMTLTVMPAGDGWEASYNYDQKPVWELGDPVNDTYAQEIYLYPRDEEHIPDWFKEEMRGSTWTPDSD